MKFTSEDLMKAMDLKVGDRIACLDSRYIFEVIKHENNIYLMCRNTNIETQFIHYLLNVDFEILPQPKRVGDLKCDDYKHCEINGQNCPLKLICYSNIIDVKIQDTLFKTLETWKSNGTYFDQEIYDILKARLDKEVKE